MAKKPYQPTKREMKALDTTVQEAVFQAELLALVVEHPHTPKHIDDLIRFLMIGAAEKLLARLKNSGVNGQLVRDVYPHAFLAAAEMNDGFQTVLQEVEASAARVIKSIQAHADRSEMAPRKYHPHAELIPSHRQKLMGHLSGKIARQ
jgi:hypothetical protein